MGEFIKPCEYQNSSQSTSSFQAQCRLSRCPWWSLSSRSLKNQEPLSKHNTLHTYKMNFYINKCFTFFTKEKNSIFFPFFSLVMLGWTNLNLRSGRKLRWMEERLPSAATSKSPTISMLSSVWSTWTLTFTDFGSLEIEKERDRWPERSMLGGRALYRRPWRSAQCAALKLNFSSLVKVQLTFFTLSVAWFYLKIEKENSMYWWWLLTQ